MTESSAALDVYRRYTDGDESALGEIVRAYADAMIFFTATLVKNPSDAEEIVSDAFADLALKKRAFRGESALRTYLYAICRHKAIDLIRKRARRGEILSLDEDQAADFETLEGRVLRTERDERLHSAMAELCEEYRVALYLVYFEEMSHEDVARAMKKSRKQTENVIFRARRALRALLEKEGFTYENI
ncbi:MAG: sigma-70 family RNA polymerase sigma factor [Clostridia bacterium]|nr:sigma-70 family RNA polymerase sigma factor [Clostridia bacterium]